MKKPSPQRSRALWLQIVAVCLAIALLGFFIAAYFVTPNPTNAQSDLVRFLYPLLAGLIASLISGGILLVLEIPLTDNARLAVSASAGLAIFILVYLKGPYWYPGLLPHTVPSPSPTVRPASSPSPAVVTPTPAFTTPATPAPTSSVRPTPTPTASVLPIQTPTPRPSPTPLPVTPAPVARAGRVLLLIEDEMILQTMMKRLADYGLRPISGQEFGDGESARIRAALPRVQAGDAAVEATIPFAVVVTGWIDSVPTGELVEATANLSATVVPGGKILRESVTARGGGRAREAARQNALREVAAQIPELYFRLIAARAR
jgi:hypothetical protein